MRTGIFVLAFFAAVWGVIGVLGTGLPAAAVAAPFLVSAAVVVAAVRMQLPERDDGARIGRLVALWSTIEGVAIFAASSVLPNLRLPDAVLPAIAIIVGLHFLPLARGMRVRLYYLTGIALVLAGTGALLLPAGLRAPLLGAAAAVTLWLTAITLLLSVRRRAAGG